MRKTKLQCTIEELKCAKIAYLYAYKIDSCPYPDEIENVLNEVKTNADYDNIKLSFELYKGLSCQDLEDRILQLIDDLPYSL